MQIVVRVKLLSPDRRVLLPSGSVHKGWLIGRDKSVLPGFKSSREFRTDDGKCTVVCSALASNSPSGSAVYSCSCDK